MRKSKTLMLYENFKSHCKIWEEYVKSDGCRMLTVKNNNNDEAMLIYVSKNSKYSNREILSVMDNVEGFIFDIECNIDTEVKYLINHFSKVLGKDSFYTKEDMAKIKKEETTKVKKYIRKDRI